MLISTAIAQGVEQKEVHRFGLVIGNKDYLGAPWRKLRSPVKDAQDVRMVLASAGFDIDSDAYFENATGRRS